MTLQLLDGFEYTLPDPQRVTVVSPDPKHPGYWNVRSLELPGNMEDYTRRPVSPKGVVLTLRHLGVNPDDSRWTESEAAK